MKTSARILAGLFCGFLAVSISAQETRTEKDLLGEKQIPCECLLRRADGAGT